MRGRSRPNFAKNVNSPFVCGLRAKTGSPHSSEPHCPSDAVQNLSFKYARKCLHECIYACIYTYSAHILRAYMQICPHICIYACMPFWLKFVFISCGLDSRQRTREIAGLVPWCGEFIPSALLEGATVCFLALAVSTLLTGGAWDPTFLGCSLPTKGLCCSGFRPRFWYGFSFS